MKSQRMKKRLIQRMTHSDKKFLIVVGVFGILTTIYLGFNESKSVFWTVYSFGLKDFLIVTLASLFIKNKNKIIDLFAIGLMCYLSMPTIIRLSCAIDTNWHYVSYRNLIQNVDYSYLLLLVIFFISMVIYLTLRHERK